MSIQIEKPKIQSLPLALWLESLFPRPNMTALDIGCGNKWYHNFLPDDTVSIDAWRKCSPTLVMDVSKKPLPFNSQAIDVVLMLDVLEHMTKDCGVFALREAQRVASDIVVGLTPLKWTTNEKNTQRGLHQDNKYNLHRSLWHVSDFPEEDGWTRVKIYGLTNYYIGIWGRW